jgi:hypothetical protein
MQIIVMVTASDNNSFYYSYESKLCHDKNGEFIQNVGAILKPWKEVLETSSLYISLELL